MSGKFWHFWVKNLEKCGFWDKKSGIFNFANLWQPCPTSKSIHPTSTMLASWALISRSTVSTFVSLKCLCSKWGNWNYIPKTKLLFPLVKGNTKNSKVSKTYRSRWLGDSKHKCFLMTKRSSLIMNAMTMVIVWSRFVDLICYIYPRNFY